MESVINYLCAELRSLKGGTPEPAATAITFATEDRASEGPRPYQP